MSEVTKIGNLTQIARRYFLSVWVEEEGMGHCDSVGGMECCRVWSEFIEAGYPVDVRGFIWKRANAYPSAEGTHLIDAAAPRPTKPTRGGNGPAGANESGAEPTPFDDLDDVINLDTWQETIGIGPNGANFQVMKGESTPEVIVLRDVGPWDQHMTITNNIEQVIEMLGGLGYLVNGRRMMYYDSEGQLTEAVRNGRHFVGFKPGVLPVK